MCACMYVRTCVRTLCARVLYIFVCVFVCVWCAECNNTPHAFPCDMLPYTWLVREQHVDIGNVFTYLVLLAQVCWRSISSIAVLSWPHLTRLYDP